ncbi:serine/threonine-protein kinase EDR1-like isoform X1 [Cynara cardunculus var. scolymus]|uniref:non-specific serine/threonine protein kinase n=1 Tax=Cynara cardunculus var. scolymus TaxID=59895 RepID=A0A124SBR1_CYNCS|nr:serine/threonine-protein kinase EDR1-like isoform X1 [Cynara cardunculus var. scolymus]KVH91420.1 Armadillo repeat-containing protein 3 and Serine/threonine-protein kinase CTR1 [Cynara cardunculus var. scolymus]
MSKMKHLLRKLHIGGGFNDHNHRLAATDTPSQPPATTQFHSSSSPSPLPTVDSLAVVDNNDSSAVDFNFFEEEFQMQLALAISVSSGSAEAREPDAETAQIKAAKQRSLGCSPSESLIEFLSLRYWSNNVVNYDEKVMDGFYDVYGITSNSVTQGKMPSLVDLQAKTVYDNVDFEVILVDRTIDKELQLLEERVSNISLECHASGTSQIISRVIQRIANIVVAQMGGPVSDADEMLRRWTTRSYELRNTHKTIILPLGCIDCGLSRHRALLFKVLADKINLACSLVKGSYYTGTDDGAVNLIKIDNGSEYIIDLMGAPGTLIPVEVPCCNLQSIELDIRRDAAGSDSFGYTLPLLDISTDPILVTPELDGFAKAGTSDLTVTSIIGSQLNSRGGNAVERNQTERFESDFGKLLPALGRSHEGLSGGGGRTSPAQKLQLNDVSKCVINAAKNPEFAQKLHAVLSKSGGTSSDSLFDVNNDEVGETEVCKTVHLLDTDMLNVGAQHGPPLVMSNYEQDLISFTAAEVNNVDDNSQLGVNWLPAKQQQLMSNKNNLGYTLPSQSTSAGFVHGHGSTGEDAMNDHAVVNSIERQYGDGVAGGGPCLINEARADNTRKGKHSDMKLVETSRIGHYTSCSNQREGISLDEVEWEIPWEDLQIGGRIGIGSYGEVYRSEWNGTEVAVKKFMNQDISGDALTQFKGEVEIMLRLRHPNVVLFMGAVTHPPNLSILTEFLPRGSLFKLLHRSNVQLDEKRRMRMALDVAKGMNYLHTSNPIIVHRDLKTPNLLVDKNWVVKVCDFGMSRMKHNTFLSSKSTAGTPEWMAPEVLRNEPSNEKCDVYSFGVILWELATLRIPWTEMNSMQVVGAVGFQFRHLDIPEHLDPVVARIISDCWHPEPQLRPSFKEIIARLKSLGHLSTDRIKTRTSE